MKNGEEKKNKKHFQYLEHFLKGKKEVNLNL